MPEGTGGARRRQIISKSNKAKRDDRSGEREKNYRAKKKMVCGRHDVNCVDYCCRRRFLLMNQDTVSKTLEFMNTVDAVSMMCTSKHINRIIAVCDHFWMRELALLLQSNKRMRKKYTFTECGMIRSRNDVTSWYAEHRKCLSYLRTCSLGTEDLVSGRWFFNFSGRAGGCGEATIQEVSFSEDKKMYMTVGYPPMRYQLMDVGPSGDRQRSSSRHSLSQSFLFPNIVRQFAASMFAEEQQTNSSSNADDPTSFGRSGALRWTKQSLHIADFPPHRVYFRMDRGTWEIKNANVTIWSVDDDEDVDNPTYCPEECYYPRRSNGSRER